VSSQKRARRDRCGGVSGWRMGPVDGSAGR
jgi:hypothetical protein